MTRSVAVPKLFPFDPHVDPIPKFRKPFTPTRGLSIAQLKTPHFESPGAIYFRLSKDDDPSSFSPLSTSLALLPDTARFTNQPAGHARSPPSVTWFPECYESHDGTIDSLACSIAVWENVTTRLGKFVDCEIAMVTEKREENQRKMEKATKVIDYLNKLHDEGTRFKANPRPAHHWFLPPGQAHRRRRWTQRVYA